MERLPVLCSARIVALLALGVGIATGDNAGRASSTVRNFAAAIPTTRQLCGNKPIRIAQIDGNGGNSWRKMTHEGVVLELAVCPKVKLTYFNAGGDLQRYITTVNTAVAERYDAIVTLDDFGSQALGALRNAHKTGLVVVPYNADPQGKVGVDYTDFISQGTPGMVAAWAKWIPKVLKGQGNVVFYGGPPGNPTDAQEYALLTKLLKKYPKIKILNPSPIDTNWDPAQYQRVLPGVLTKYPKIDVAVSDYVAGYMGALRGYINADKQPPALAGAGSTNQFGCLFNKYQKKWPNFQVLTVEGNWCDRGEDAIIDENNRRYSALAMLLRSRYLIDIDCWSDVTGQPIKPSTICGVIADTLNNHRGTTQP